MVNVIVVNGKRKDDKTSSVTCVIADPRSHVARSQPGVVADPGFMLILSEGNGKGRKSFMTWFGNAHAKQEDAVGDLILDT